HKVRETPCHQGTGHPTPAECEKVTWTHYKHELLSFDVVHDFSTEKTVAQEMLNLGRENVISTMLGGNWSKPSPAGNVCVWSHAMRQRALRGVTDYWGTGSPDLAGPPFNALRDAHVVYGGVDTGFYALPD